MKLIFGIFSMKYMYFFDGMYVKPPEPTLYDACRSRLFF